MSDTTMTNDRTPTDTPELWSTGDIASWFDVPQHRVAYAIRRGEVRHVARIAGVRLYDLPAVELIGHELRQVNDHHRDRAERLAKQSERLAKADPTNPAIREAKAIHRRVSRRQAITQRMDAIIATLGDESRELTPDECERLSDEMEQLKTEHESLCE